MAALGVSFPATQIGHNGIERGVGDAAMRQRGEDADVAGIGAHHGGAGKREGGFGCLVGLGILSTVIIHHGDGGLPHGERL